jgi:hypothetical protein
VALNVSKGSFVTSFFAAGRIAGLFLFGLVFSATVTAQAPQLLPDYAVWPHDISDLKADPRIRYGQLANGMRYAIQQTNRPEGHVAIRLRFAAGSLHETDKEQGLAHYLEHMAFQGSKNLTRNEFVQKLQRLGLSFGADTNASTGFDQTVYMLNLPRNDAQTFGESMQIMREVADHNESVGRFGKGRHPVGRARARFTRATGVETPLCRSLRRDEIAGAIPHRIGRNN